MTQSYRTLNDALLHNAAEFGGAAALLLPRGTRSHGLSGESINWNDLAEWVTFLAAELTGRMTPGERLIHVVSNSVDDVLIALACQAAGIVEIPVDAEGGEDYVDSCRRRVDARWFDGNAKRDLIDRAKHRRIHFAGPNIGVLPSVAPKDDALILWTSGTSGEPKGVVLSHESLLANALAKLDAVGQRRTDRRLTVLSIAHAYARTCDLNTWLLSGCTLAITRGFQGWQEWARDVTPTLCNTVPSLADRIIDGGVMPRTLRILGCGGAAMSGEQFAHWRDHGVTVIQGYGLTEAGPVVASQSPEDSIAGRVGRFVTGWEYRLGGVDLPKNVPGQESMNSGFGRHVDGEGRLFVRGRHVMSRYWDDAESTSRRVDRDGWLDTGDVVRVCQSSGQLEILGRCDDRIILSNGHSVDPGAVERRISGVIGLQTAVLVAGADGRSLELWVEADDDRFSQSELRSALIGLPAWEQPGSIHFFQIPDSVRDRVFNRKGAVRRGEMLRFLRSPEL
ncbi:MAG: long-chain fatty acid--CoA ligase [Planctomycetales bacterium]|nr:long-chain fatty acid--CoA ligase [Planctomycetales bacterium]